MILNLFCKKLKVKKLIRLILVAAGFTAFQSVCAQTLVESGKVISIEIPVKTDFACNIEVLRGGVKTDVSVDPNSKKGIYEFAGREIGEETVRWQGMIKFRGLRTLVACQGDGEIKVVTTESAKSIEAAKQAKAAMDAQAARLAELEAKLKAAEAAAAKTPEQKAVEARIAAEAKAFAEAKVAAEIKAAEKTRADAEAKAAADARAAAKARAEAEVKAAADARAAAAARAEAEAAMNKPLRKSDLREGKIYTAQKSQCKDDPTVVCLGEIQTKQMCDWSSGITVNARESATITASPRQFREWLESGGDITNFNFVWSDIFKGCMASWTVEGIYRGTNTREVINRKKVTKFIYTRNREILIHDREF